MVRLASGVLVGQYNLSKPSKPGFIGSSGCRPYNLPAMFMQCPPPTVKEDGYQLLGDYKW
ncbi:hypothetical protein SCA6_020449 [Theobroma cacao]